MEDGLIKHLLQCRRGLRSHAQRTLLNLESTEAWQFRTSQVKGQGQPKTPALVQVLHWEDQENGEVSRADQSVPIPGEYKSLVYKPCRSMCHLCVNDRRNTQELPSPHTLVSKSVSASLTSNSSCNYFLVRLSILL